jgi:hypothetical protein
VSEIFPHGFSAQLGIHEELYFGFQRIMVRWRAISESFARSVLPKHHSPLQR